MGAPATHTSAVDGRVIIHLDLDAFYAQVETVRLGLDPAIPVRAFPTHHVPSP